MLGKLLVGIVGVVRVAEIVVGSRVNGFCNDVFPSFFPSFAIVSGKEDVVCFVVGVGNSDADARDECQDFFRQNLDQIRRDLDVFLVAAAEIGIDEAVRLGGIEQGERDVVRSVSAQLAAAIVEVGVGCEQPERIVIDERIQRDLDVVVGFGQHVDVRNELFERHADFADVAVFCG